jgi:chorismate lyase / 3-hydroxybenzoate synthase
MPAHALRARVAEAYVAIGDTLSHFDRHPIRFWNFLPDPGAIMDGGLDRYMIFNAGRFDGYMRWPGRSSERGPSLPAASAVGSVGDDIVVHCLASDEVSTPIENPRQKPAWQYSPRYGPVPPCFSRATIATVGSERVLLIGGTASIVGEDSRHGEDVGEQLAETLKNLEALIDASCGGPQKESSLGRLIDLRTYVAREQDAPAIRSVLAARCTRAARIELTIANLCRRELIVEIEGLARVGGVQTG